MEQRKHWWNGRWGRLGRRDIYLSEDGGLWLVEAREGGAEGRSRWWQVDDEDAAIDLAGALMDDSDGWRELTVSRPPGWYRTPGTSD